MNTAPLDWAWFTFPLAGEAEETLTLDDAVRHAHDLLDRAEATGERAHIGPVLHWAHHLKTEQNDAGDWPAFLNARTGETLSPERTLSPVGLMRRLEDILQSTEFTNCIARAGWHDPPTPKELTG